MQLLAGKKIGFIGGGQMAEAILGGMLSVKAVQPCNVFVSDISSERLTDLQKRFAVQTILNQPETNSGAVQIAKQCDIIILAVKPQYLAPVLESTQTGWNKDIQTVISIVGGITLEFLQRYICAPIVRVMPNTPMFVGDGVAGIALGKNCTDMHQQLACEIFDLVGTTYILPEKLIDPLTSVSGCGPAYAYMFIEAMADGGVQMGLPRDTALQLAARTLLGAANMVLITGEHPAKLKDSVCSPAGGTIAGVHALEQGCFRGTIINAVNAGMNRMSEIGKQ